MLTIAPIAAQAQDGAKSVFSGEAKKAYTSIKNNLVSAAEKMPEENYGFKPVPEIRSFGALVAHIADANTFFCGSIKGEQKTPNAASKTTKADLVAALKEAFEFCDGAYDSLTDASASEMVKSRMGEMSRLGLAYRNIGHDNEEYGYLAVYLRLKGVVPPSSEKR
jgi:uncharacterized damage-inducible protein DinB